MNSEQQEDWAYLGAAPGGVVDGLAAAGGVVVALEAAATLVLVLARALGLPVEGLAAGALAGGFLRLPRPPAPLLLPAVALEWQCRPHG